MHKESKHMKQTNQWKPLDLSNLVDKLTEAKTLLEQAAALAAAREGDKVRTMAELQRSKVEETQSGGRRRYR
jgi:hypothetical protein